MRDALVSPSPTLDGAVGGGGRSSSTVRHAAVGTAMTDALMLGLGAVTGILVARWLKPDGRGALDAALFWPGLLSGLGSLSIHEATIYLLGRRPADSRSLIASSFWTSLVLALLIGAIGFVLLPLLLGPARAALVPLARMYLLTFVPAQLLSLSVLSASQGELRFARYNGLRLLLPPLYLAAVLGLWSVGRLSVGTVVAANAFTAILATTYRVSIYAGILRFATLSNARALVRTGLSFHPATVLLLLGAQSDHFVVLMLGDNRAVGRYAVAQSIASPAMLLLSMGLYRAIFPYLSHLSGRAAQADLLARGVRALMVVLTATTLLVMAPLPWLLPAVFGPSFADVVAPARILVIAYMLVALKSMLVYALKGLGDGRGGMIAVLISLISFAALVPFLGARLELIGVGLSLALANLVSLSWLGWYLRAHYGVAPHRLWGLRRSTVREVAGGLVQVFSRFRVRAV
jgi:O-antigen/teichoic acid export membrane protein